MKFVTKKSRPEGAVKIPGSKSHTIRGLVMALHGGGVSELIDPLDSSDTRSCFEMIQNFGAKVTDEGGRWIIECEGPRLPDNVVDVGNSGTSLYIGMGIASLLKGYTVYTGDSQIRRRPAGPLIQSINDLGGHALSTRNNGCPPAVIGGPLRGGKTVLEAVTSQYLSSLLMAAPLGEGDCSIDVPLLNEAPYVTMTLDWLDMAGIEYRNDNYRNFTVPGGQKYRPFSRNIPADFSSATFFLVAAAITGGEVVLQGLDMEDSQGDKEVVNILEKMGALVEKGNGEVKITGKTLIGGSYDLNAIPDALPALSVAACFARGETRLYNVAQARVKETDRISVMRGELTKLGATVEEMEDGLIIEGTGLTGGTVEGHGDHRIVMAMAVAGLGAEGPVTVTTAESAAVTFPAFRGLLLSLGCRIERED